MTDLRRKTFERAVKLLAAKPRSIAELRERLLKLKDTNEEVVEAVIARLREYGYLNDERLASLREKMPLWKNSAVEHSSAP